MAIIKLKDCTPDFFYMPEKVLIIPRLPKRQKHFFGEIVLNVFYIFDILGILRYLGSAGRTEPFTFVLPPSGGALTALAHYGILERGRAVREG